MIDWTGEEIAKRTTDEIKSLRKNAEKKSNQHVVELCDAELTRRKLPKKQKQNLDETRDGQYVSEFHFVCADENGVTRNPDGTIWTCTWVVSEQNAETAVKYGSIVALHNSKAEPSYLQGRIKGWRKAPRQKKYAGDQIVKTPSGIDFMFEPTDVPLAWQGDGSGEKGYAWGPIPLS